MKKLKKLAVKALSLAVAAVTALSVGLSASAAEINGVDREIRMESSLSPAPAEIMSNDWSFLVVFCKSVDVTVDLFGKTVDLKKTISNKQIDKIKQNVIDRMPYQFMQDTHGKVGIDVIDYAYIDEPLTNKDIELGVAPSDYNSPGYGKGYRADVGGSELVSGVLDECLEKNFYSQIMIFTPLGEISPYVGGWGGSKYSGVNIAQIIMYDDIEFSYYDTILHEICHGLETDSKALNNDQTAPLHDMYWGNNAGIAELDWYEYYMNDIRPDRKKGVEPMAFYRLRSEKYTPLAGDMIVTTPSDFSATVRSNTAADLSWVGITGHAFQVGVFKDAAHKELQTTYDVKSGEASFELTDLVKGNTYYLGVRETMTVSGKTFYSDWNYLTYVHAGVAAGVENLRVEDLNKGGVSAKLKFSWDAVPNASGYQIAQFSDNLKYYDIVYDSKSAKTSAVLGTFTRYTYPCFGIRSSETISGETVWSDWTYIAFELGEDIELIDPNRREITSKSIPDLPANVITKTVSYTGNACTTEVKITDGGRTLKKGTDYTLTYKNNTAIGTASVTIKGKGEYSGKQTLTFTIAPKKALLTATKSGAKITLKWNSVKGAEKYVIYYCEKGSSKYKALATVSGSKTSYSTSKLDKSKSYQFKIRSYAVSGGKKYYSIYSNIATV